MAPFPSITDLYSLRPIEGDRQRVKDLGWYIFSRGSWLPERLVPPKPEEPQEAPQNLPAVTPLWGDPASPQSAGYIEEKEKKMTEMTSPTIGKLDTDVNNGAGVDPATALPSFTWERTMPELYLLDLDDIRAAGLSKEQEEGAILGVRQFGRKIAEQPAFLQLRSLDESLRKRREELKEKFMQPSPQILAQIEKDPTVEAARKQRESVMSSLGIKE